MSCHAATTCVDYWCGCEESCISRKWRSKFGREHRVRIFRDQHLKMLPLFGRCVQIGRSSVTVEQTSIGNRLNPLSFDPRTTLTLGTPQFDITIQLNKRPMMFDENLGSCRDE